MVTDGRYHDHQSVSIPFIDLLPSKIVFVA